MPPEGIEPSTSRLRGACSAEIELRRQSGHSRGHRIWRSYSVLRDRISGARGRTKPSRRQTLHGEGGIRTPNVRTHAGFTDQVPNRSVSSPSVFGVPYAPGTNSVFFFGVSDAPETTKAGSPFGPGLSILPHDESRSTGQALPRHNRSCGCRWAVVSTWQNARARTTDATLPAATVSRARCDATRTLKAPLR
jgi:hypothetical protein